jgi:hypothetical protein
MPIYIYAVINDDGSEGEVFEVLQDMDEPELRQHPETGQPVQRLISAPNAPRRWTDSQARSKLDPKNLERLGFTQYKKSGKGVYEKTAGAGPDTIVKQ